MKPILTLVAFCILGLPLKAQTSFKLSSTLIVGNGPSTVVAADVNGDGKVDLISANGAGAVGNTLSVLTNNGSGGFGLASTPSVGNGPTGVTATDVNGDGKVDLISANYSDSRLSVLTNNGSGGFVTSGTYTVGNNPFLVIAVDVNGDGKMDLVSANYGGDSLSVLTNNGSGGFVPASTLNVGFAPISVAAADVNGDGKVDLISVNFGDSMLTVLTNDGTGGFVTANTYPVGQNPRFVTATDFNGDGKVDLISADFHNSTLTVLTNNGSGGFALAATLVVGGGTTWVVPADVNGDGKVDLITPDSNVSSLTVLTNNGSGGFVVAPTPNVGPNPYSVAAADVNGDGRVDLISANSGGNTLTVLTNATPFPPATLPVITAQPSSATNLVGTTASFSVGVTAKGLEPARQFAYQWRLGGTNLPARTNHGLVLLNLSTNQSGSYDVVISNFVGSVTSSVATLTVGFAPSISLQPTNQNVAAGTTLDLEVSAGGTAPLNYQWYNDAGAIPGQTNSSLILNAAQTNDAANYTVIVSSPFGAVTSQVATVFVFVPISFLAQPSSQVVPVLAPASFSVIASGFPDPTSYQWMLNGTNLPGATSSSLSINHVTLANTGNYQVLVDNGYSSSNSAVATLNMSPSIISPFTGAILIWGQNPSISIGAIGSGPLNFQWYLNGVAVDGATNATVNFTGIQFTNGGLYSVVVSSPFGSVTNAAAQVIVNPAGVSIGFYPGLTINGQAGYSYTIQRSTNLADTNSWVTLTNVTLTQPVELWVDPSVDASSPFNPLNFYRVLPGQ